MSLYREVQMEGKMKITDYDEYYVYDLDETIKQLSKVAKDHYALLEAGVDEHEIDYYYRAWY